MGRAWGDVAQHRLSSGCPVNPWPGPADQSGLQATMGVVPEQCCCELDCSSRMHSLYDGRAEGGSGAAGYSGPPCDLRSNRLSQIAAAVGFDMG